MRDPNLIPTVLVDDDKFEIVKMNGLPDFNVEDYDLNDEKEFNKYLDSIVKKDVRTSWEYRKFTAFLRQGINMNRCAFFKNVNNIDSTKVKIHIHHEPFTLPDIARTVIEKRKECGESLDEHLVAKEIMYLHFNLLVGLIPLSETVHTLVHNSYLYIPMDKVLGGVRVFYDMYKPWIPEDVQELLEKNDEFCMHYNEAISRNSAILQKHYIYLDMSGAYELPELEKVVEAMNEVIKDENKQPEAQEDLIDIIQFIK